MNDHLRQAALKAWVGSRNLAKVKAPALHPRPVADAVAMRHGTVGNAQRPAATLTLREAREAVRPVRHVLSE